MSLHFGMCYGPIDLMTRIKINGKVAWTGEKDGGIPITINERELFGGIKKEGGAVGDFQFLPGEPSQVIPEILAAKVGRTQATMPAYRGQASCWFYEAPGGFGGNSAGRKGFYWSANQPFIPPVEILATRASFSLSSNGARLWRPADENLIRQTANPSADPPWRRIQFPTLNTVVVTGLSDPFGGNDAFTLQDNNTAIGFADRSTQFLGGVHNNQRLITSVYIERDIGQSIFSALLVLADGGGNAILSYDHETDAIDLVKTGAITVHESGILVGPGLWRRLFIDLSQTTNFQWQFNLYPAYGSAVNFPGPEEASPTGTIKFYGPMVQRIPPTQ